MTNDELREKIASAGITSFNVTQKQLQVLHERLSEALEASDCFKGEYRMDGLDLTDPKYLTCSSDYFEQREAVSFNSDGFIGFAGWASTSNTVPIKVGVINWLAELTA